MFSPIVTHFAISGMVDVPVLPKAAFRKLAAGNNPPAGGRAPNLLIEIGARAT
jgi:hypothetical protein